MNHDATHCDDYKVNKCPKKCYRAQLTQDLRERHDYFSYRLVGQISKGRMNAR